MSDTENHHREDEEHRKVREVLKGLPGKKAPWFFEARLQQRLQEERNAGKSRGWLTTPAPAYALSAVTAAVLVIVGYYTLYLPFTRGDEGTGVPEQMIESGEGITRPSPGESNASPPPSRRTTEVFTPAEKTTKGPSSVSTEPAIEAPVMKRESTSGAEMKSQDSQHDALQHVELPVTPARAVETPVGTIHMRLDSLAGSAGRDSIDTLQSRRDSVLQK